MTLNKEWDPTKNLYLLKGHIEYELLKEFPSKRWNEQSLEAAKINLGHHLVGDLLFSQKGAPYQSVLEISRITGIHQSSVSRIIPDQPSTQEDNNVPIQLIM